MLSLTIIAGFFLMLFLPCAFAVFSSRERQDPSLPRGARATAKDAAPEPRTLPARPAQASPGRDLEAQLDPAMARPRVSSPAPAPALSPRRLNLPWLDLNPTLLA